MGSSAKQDSEPGGLPVTLITGTSRGIGRHLAEHYVERGHLVVGCSRSSSEWSAEGYHHLQADIRNEAEVLALFRELRSTHRRLDHLINNAGVASMNHVLTTPISTVRSIFDVNVISAFLFAREAAKLMMRRRFGRIVNLTSVAVPLNLEGEAAYAASKSALEGLTRVMAKDLGSFGITVNAVGPGPIETRLIRGVPKDRLDALLKRLAIPEFGTAADVANAVDFFLLPASRLVTGQVLYLGGA
jgi:3-oxoacyl-[acyl-carrier protein] reductase